VNQPDDVWFLAGTFGGKANRTCTIPAGKPAYFPVMNQMLEVLDADLVEQALEECDPRPLKTSADLDGDQLKIDTATSEGAFRFSAGPDSLIATPNSDFLAVACGDWVGPLDLSPGEHLLRFTANSEDFALDVTYRLVVR